MKNIMFMMLLLTPSVVAAGDVYLKISGRSIHEGNGNYNENNTGVGLEYAFDTKSRWQKIIAVDRGRDSSGDMSNAVGGSIMYHLLSPGNKPGWKLGVGGFAGVVTRKTYRNNSPFFFAAPALVVGSKKIMLNIIYVPRIKNRTVNTLFFQLKFLM